MKNLYQNAKMVILEKSTAVSKHNKLMKIQFETEDVEFKDLLQKAIDAYGYYIKPGCFRNAKNENIPDNFKEWCTLVNKVKEPLMVYIDERLSENKLEWQVIAERNGWTPPTK
jgi:hypothetical protein